MMRVGTLFERLFQPAQSLQLTSWLFLRLLALIYLAAFVSLALEIDGLAGPQGIMPFKQELDGAFAEWAQRAWLWYPTIFWWLEPTDLALQASAWLGVLLSLLLLTGRWQRPALIGLFLLYLSLFHAGQFFTNFQWDALLLETGLLAIFVVGGPSLLLVLLFEWLLFRLRFMSGFFKLASGDPSWSGFTALHHYFETQPLPHIGAWYAQLLPEWMLKAGVGLTFFSELIVPFFIFLPRPFRLAAAGITIIMQLLIIATSNHNFINLLTILLCLFLLDDRVVAKLLPQGLKRRLLGAAAPKPGRLHAWSVSLLALVIVSASLISFSANSMRLALPGPLHQYTDAVRRLGIGNIYHIFPTMQVERQELVIEGSDDGETWQAYAFRYKPGEPDRAPAFIVPHQPRLDWLMWFVPTQQGPHMYWFDLFLRRLHEGSPSVTRLLQHNPFAESPPRYLRVLVYRYRFSTPHERRHSGAWWQREYLGIFPRTAPRKP